MADESAKPPRKAPPRVHLFGRQINLPRSRPLRLALGILLVVGGVMGFLPVLGFWMIPLGLSVLAYDWPRARRWARRIAVFFGRFFKEKGGRR